MINKMTLSASGDVFHSGLELRGLTYESNEIIASKSTRSSYGEYHQLPLRFCSSGPLLTIFGVEFSVTEFDMFTTYIKAVSLQLEAVRKVSDFTKTITFYYHFQRENLKSLRVTFIINVGKEEEIYFKLFDEDSSIFAYDQLEQLNYEFKEFANFEKYFNFK